jgi:o-succinylbenzoate---CoA ligase
VTGATTPLAAICLPVPQAAKSVLRAWGRGEAVAVLDPSAPARKTSATLAALRPTRIAARDRSALVEAQAAGVAQGVAALIATSGTTGEARLVELTRQAMRASAQAVSSALGATSEDHWLLCVPLHHVAGLSVLSRCFETGASLTVHDGFDVAEVARAASSCTLVSVVPTMLGRLLDARAPMDRFRRVIVGGAPLDHRLLRRARDAGVRVTTTYGLTETSGGCVHDGRPVPGVETSLSATGEILVRGPVLMRGYHGDDRATKEAVTDDGWLLTGDLGRADDDGTLVVTDRVKDLIVTGGVNVAPSAVEAVLENHPALAAVCVAGLEDEHWGERVVAFVVPRHPSDVPSDKELRAFCSEWLSPPELPRQVVPVEAIPRTASGKISRQLLVSRAAP